MQSQADDIQTRFWWDHHRNEVKGRMPFAELFPDPDDCLTYPVITIQLFGNCTWGGHVDQTEISERLLAALRQVWTPDRWFADGKKIDLVGKSMPPWPWITPETAALTIAYMIAAETNNQDLKNCTIEVSFWSPSGVDPVLVYEELFPQTSKIHEFWLYNEPRTEIIEDEDWSLANDLFKASCIGEEDVTIDRTHPWLE